MIEPFKLARSIRHTQPRQLASRAAKTVKRALADRLGPAIARRGLSAPAPGVAPGAPQPVFAPRTHLIESSGGAPSARLLGTTLSLRAGIEWRPRAWSQLQLVNLHYMEFLEALDDDAFAHVASDWIAIHPPGARGGWRIAWNSYALSLRVVVWMQQLALRRERLPREVVDAMHASLAVQLRFLERNLEDDLGGNHVIKNAKALIWAGRYFDGMEARRWSRAGERLLANELTRQVLDDGVHFERSPSYHAQVFGDLIECAAIASDAVVRAGLMVSLEAMAQALADLTHPDGGPSLFNDGGLHMAYATSELLAAYERAGGRPVRLRPVFALPSAGYYGVRSQGSFLLADCGPIAPDHLPAHGHGDILAFEWSVDGRRVIVDAGVFDYERGPKRDASRATRSHNTVTVDDSDQCEFWASFRVGRRARVERRRYEANADGFVLEGAHDGFTHLTGRPRHVRTITGRADGVAVEDRIEGGAGQRVRARLLLHPDARVERFARGVRIDVGGILITLDTPHAVDIVASTWWPDFGVSLATLQLVIEYPPAPCSGSFKLARELYRSQSLCNS